MSETRQFKMHPNLLMDIIKRQAGTIEKSWLEAIMNSIDAGAKHINITITKEQTIIKDDGKGMGKEEVLKYFEVFGLPHTQDEQKTYGEFRMGRGQLFAHGINVWRTNGLEMVVDVEKTGLEYVLKEHEDHFRGCEIKVSHYKPLEDFREKVDSLKEWIKFVPVKVIINDIQLKHEEKKVYESEYAKYYIQIGEGTLTVYNQGVRVMDLNEFGIKGSIVSKKPIKVNFARNDIMSDCQIWQCIRPELNNLALDMFKNRQRLPEIAKKWILNKCNYSKVVLNMFMDSPIIRSSSGGWLSIRDITSANVPIIFAENGDKLADKAMQRGTVISIDNNYRTVKGILSENSLISKEKFISLEDLKKDNKINTKSSDVNIESLKPRERKNLKCLILWNKEYISNPREIKVGTGNARAWTDGKSYIYINKDELQIPFFEFASVLPTILIHEYCHDDNSEETDVHGEVFYEKFHEMLIKQAPNFVVGMEKIIRSLRE